MADIYKSEAGKREVLDKYLEILSKWPVNNQQYNIDTAYGSTFVIESGEKSNPPLLLLHGSVSNSFTWYGEVEVLSKHYNVYAVDIIGEAGLSAPERPPYSGGAYTRWLKEVVDGCGISICSMVGLSLGGWMALSFATTYPEKMHKLVLLCPGGLAPVKAGFIWKAILFSFLGKWGKYQIQRMITGGKLPSTATPGLEKALAFTSLISKNFRPRFGKLPIYSLEELSRLKMPVLTLFGDRDWLLSAEDSMKRLQKAVPGAVCEWLPETGHVIVNQADRILRFLAA